MDYTGGAPTRNQELYLHRLARPGTGYVTSEDIDYWHAHRQYPPREITNKIKFHVALGVIEDDGKYMSDGRVMIGAGGIYGGMFLCNTIEAATWKSKLGDHYPRKSDWRLVEVFAKYTEGHNAIIASELVEVSGPLFTEWLQDQVRFSRDMIYHINLIYDKRSDALFKTNENEWRGLAAV